MGIPVWTVGEVLTASDVNSWFVPLEAVKASDTTRSNNVTLASDPDLVLALAASSTYKWELWLNYEGGTQGSSDLQLGWALPSGATLEGSATYVNASGGNVVEVNIANASVLVPGTNGGGAIRGFFAKGSIVTTNNGNMQLKWAQNTLSGTATNVHAQSYLMAQKIS